MLSVAITPSAGRVEDAEPFSIVISDIVSSQDVLLEMDEPDGTHIEHRLSVRLDLTEAAIGNFHRFDQVGTYTVTVTNAGVTATATAEGQ